MKLYLDEDISPKVSVILRKRGMDAISAHETEMLEASDAEQLSNDSNPILNEKFGF